MQVSSVSIFFPQKSANINTATIVFHKQEESEICYWYVNNNILII